MSQRDRGGDFDAQSACEGSPGAKKTCDENVTTAAHHLRLAAEAIARAITRIGETPKLDSARYSIFCARRDLGETNLIGPIAEPIRVSREQFIDYEVSRGIDPQQALAEWNNRQPA